MLLTSRLAVYLFKIAQKVQEGKRIGALMKCPECGIRAEDMDTEQSSRHTLIKRRVRDTNLYYVVIGCEGYWTVDPQKLGMKRGDWEPLHQIIKRNIHHYSKVDRTYSRGVLKVTAENEAHVRDTVKRDGTLNDTEKAKLLRQLDDLNLS